VYLANIPRVAGRRTLHVRSDGASTRQRCVRPDCAQRDPELGDADPAPQNRTVSDRSARRSRRTKGTSVRTPPSQVRRPTTSAGPFPELKGLRGRRYSSFCAKNRSVLLPAARGRKRPDEISASESPCSPEVAKRVLRPVRLGTPTSIRSRHPTFNFPTSAESSLAAVQHCDSPDPAQVNVCNSQPRVPCHHPRNKRRPGYHRRLLTWDMLQH
jgi:hypothetical protein